MCRAVYGRIRSTSVLVATPLHLGEVTTAARRLGLNVVDAAFDVVALLLHHGIVRVRVNGGSAGTSLTTSAKLS